MTERPTCNCTTMGHSNHLGRACDQLAKTASGLCGTCTFMAWSKKQDEEAREPHAAVPTGRGN